MNFQKITMLVLASIFFLSPFAYAEELDITAASAVVMEAKTGTIVYKKNADEQRPPASTTKIMTALLTLEKKGDSLNEVAVASKKAANIGESSIWLIEGEKLKLSDLLYGLLLNSGNDAAITLAEYIGGSEEKFVELMNQRAQELGAIHTHFANPNGLPNEEHYTTAKDLALITRYALENPKFAQIVSTKTKDIPWPGHEWSRHLLNTNKLLWRLEGANGVKTGFTDKAGHCLVSSAKRNGQQYIAVVLGSSNVWDDSTKLLEYAFANFERINIYQAREEILEVPVKNGMEEKIHLLAAKQLDVVIPKGKSKEIIKKALLKSQPIAPLNEGETIGQVKIYLGKEEIGQGELITDKQVHPKTFLRTFIKQFWGVFSFMIKSLA